jgi:hypothetical protein
METSRTLRIKRLRPILLLATIAVAAIVAALLWWRASRPMSYALDYDRLIHLDAEDLAETGIGEAYNKLRPELGKYIREPARLEELIDANAPRYSVKCGEREFVIYAPGDEDESWGRATFALFTIVNDQLANSEFRLYAVNGGNDLGGMFLTPVQARTAQAGLPNKSDWPYLPDNVPPWYGQHH